MAPRSVFLLVAYLLSVVALSWRRIDDLPSGPRALMAAAIVGDEVFFVAGVNTQHYSDKIDVFNMAVQRWNASLTLPGGGRADCSAVGTNGVLIIAGGQDISTILSRVEILNVTSRTWMLPKTLSTARQAMGAVSLKKLAIFAGGLLQNGISDIVVDMYDTETQLWRVAQLSMARYSITSITVGDFAFFAGGIDDTSGTSAVDIFNSVSWISSNLQTDRYGMAAAAIGNSVMFAGGLSTSTGTTSAVVEIFDIVSGQWTSASLQYPRVFLSGGSIGNTAMFCGGIDAQPNVVSSTTELFLAGEMTSSRGPELNIGRYEMVSASVGTSFIVAGGIILTPSLQYSAVVEILELPAYCGPLDLSNSATCSERGWIILGTVEVSGTSILSLSGITQITGNLSISDSSTVVISIGNCNECHKEAILIEGDAKLSGILKVMVVEENLSSRNINIMQIEGSIDGNFDQVVIQYSLHDNNCIKAIGSTIISSDDNRVILLIDMHGQNECPSSSTTRKRMIIVGCVVGVVLVVIGILGIVALLVKKEMLRKSRQVVPTEGDIFHVQQQTQRD